MGWSEKHIPHKPQGGNCKHGSNPKQDQPRHPPAWRSQGHKRCKRHDGCVNGGLFFLFHGRRIVSDKSIEIKITADGRQARQGLKDTSQALEQVQDSAQGAGAAQKEAGSVAQEMGQKAQAGAQGVDAAAQALEQVQDSAQGAGAAQKEAGSAAQEMGQKTQAGVQQAAVATSEAEKAAASAAQASTALTLATQGVASANRAAKTAALELSAAVSQYGATSAEAEKAGQANRQAQEALAGAMKTKVVAANAAAQANKKLKQALDEVRGSARAGARGLDDAAQALDEVQDNAKEAGAAQKSVGNTAQEMGKKAQAGARQAAQGAGLVQQSTHRIRDGVESISTQLDKAQAKLMGFLGIQMGADAVKDVIGLADAYKNLQSRIGLVAGEGGHLAKTMDDVQAVALRTHSALEGTGVLFTRIAQAGKDAGLSLEQATEQSLALTESINQAVAISGAGAAASDAAITQLIQGLQSGVLRGEEFNSVMEQAPRLARALADGLGVTTGELRKLAESGALTTDVVIKSLQSQGQALEAEFGKLPLTVGRAMTDVQTAFMRYVADVDEANGVTEKMASTIGFVGEHLEALADTLTMAGKGWLAFKAYNMAQAWLDKAKAIKVAKAAVQDETLATQANTQGKAANTAAAKAQATAAAASTTATDANTAATVANTAAIAASTAAQAANAMERAGITGFLGASTKATQASTAAITANTTAKAASTRVSGLLGGAISATAGAARGLMGVLGGPLGLAITVATFGSEIKKGIGAVVEWGAGFTAAGRQMKASTAALAEMERQEKINAELRRQQAREDAARAAATELAIARQFGLSKAAQAATAEFTKLTKEGKTAAQAVADIAKGFDTTSQQGLRDFGAILNKLAADGKLTAEQLKAAWGQILKGEDLQLFQMQARQAFAGTAQEAQIMAQIAEATLTQALQRTGLSLGVLTGGMGEAARSAINDVQTIANSLDALAQQGVDTGVALTASIGKAIDTADSQKAIEAVRGQIEGLRTQLGDTITDGLLQQTEQKAKDLKKALDDATPGIQSAEEAMRKLGITSSEAAIQSRAAFEMIRDSGTASASDIRQAFGIAAQAAIAAADGQIPSWVRSQAAANGYRIEIDKAGNQILVLAEHLRRVGDTNRNVTGNMAGDWQNLGNVVQRVQQQIQQTPPAPKPPPKIGTDGEEIKDKVSAAKGGGSFSALAYQQNAKDVHELDAWWEEWNAEYQRKNAKYGGTSLSLSKVWYETQKAQYKNARRDIEMRERIQQNAEARRGAAAPAPVQHAAQSGGATYVSNYTIPWSGQTVQAQFKDAGSQQAVEQLLRELAQAKGVAS